MMFNIFIFLLALLSLTTLISALPALPASMLSFGPKLTFDPPVFRPWTSVVPRPSLAYYPTFTGRPSPRPSLPHYTLPTGHASPRPSLPFHTLPIVGPTPRPSLVAREADVSVLSLGPMPTADPVIEPEWPVVEPRPSLIAHPTFTGRHSPFHHPPWYTARPHPVPTLTGDPWFTAQPSPRPSQIPGRPAIAGVGDDGIAEN